MSRDPFELEIADLLNAELPAPAPELEARALSALAGVRPRRHPNLVRVLLVLLILLLLAAVLYATARRHFVEGTLQWREGTDEATASRPSWSDSTERFLSGNREWQTGVLDTGGPEVSPVTHLKLSTSSPSGEGWPPRVLDVMVASPDSSRQVNLTARLGGMNCMAAWSPDGKLVAFSHREPASSGLSCRVPPQVWVVNADGSGARRVGPSGALATNDPAWSPDGARLLMWVYDEWPQPIPRGHAVTADLQGKHVRILPNVGCQAVYSPDGSKIVSRRMAAGTRKGGPGVWNRLLLTRADGTHPRVVAEQFVSDGDVAAHQRRLSEDPRLHEHPGWEWRDLVRDGVAPRRPVWSPRSDQIAFLAAPTFDPKGVWYSDQLEVWVYDLRTQQKVRLTYDHVSHTALQWK